MCGDTTVQCIGLFPCSTVQFVATRLNKRQKKNRTDTGVGGAVASPLIKSHNPADDYHRRRSDTRRTGFIGDIGKRPDRHALVRP